jgi:TolB-like protein/class 3 adenylate cyclase/Tfp pilus assembly protein PilF
MAAARVERRLAAILAADVVGYSSLMEHDEDRTLARLKAHRREFIEPLIAEYQGRIVTLMGDGALVEFASVVDAVRCAVLIQQGMAEREAEVPEAERIRFRIGINLGDVIREPDGDLYGDGVNVAARLEQLAEPGGVVVSGTAYDHLQGKLDLPLEFAGEQRVKNIERLVRAYRVRLDGTVARFGWRRPRRLGHRAVAAGLLLALVLAAGAWWWGAGQSGGPPLPDKPSIAILPFNNISDDPRWERLAGGLAEDIVTDLARRSEIFVIAPASTAIYKGKALDVKEVGRALGVRYVLEGSVQAEGDQVRVTAQLIDTTTNAHLWAQRYDRPAADLFAIQDEITAQVGSTLGGFGGKLAQAQLGLSKQKPPASLEAYDLYLLGIEQKHKFSKEGMLAADKLLRRVVELDPGFARAWSALGAVHGISALNGFADDPQAANRLWKEYTLQALSLDPLEPNALTNLGAIHALEGDLAAAKKDWDYALATFPSNADALVNVAWNAPLTIGEPERMVELARRAIRLNPYGPSWYYLALGIAEFASGHYRETVAAMEKTPLEGAEPLLYLAMAHAELGDTDQTAKAVQRIRTEFPGFTVEGYIRDFPVVYPPALAAFHDAGQKAGLMPLVQPTQ